MSRSLTFVLAVLLTLASLFIPAFQERLNLLLMTYAISTVFMDHATDEALIGNFRSHRQGFEELLAMVREDRGLARVDDSWTSPGDPSAIGVSPARLELYRQRFTTLGIARGFEDFGLDRSRIRFIASTQGISVSGSAKGYAWLASAPEDLVPDLDAFRARRKRSFFAHRHIESNWYLFFDYED